MQRITADLTYCYYLFVLFHVIHSTDYEIDKAKIRVTITLKTAPLGSLSHLWSQYQSTSKTKVCRWSSPVSHGFDTGRQRQPASGRLQPTAERHRTTLSPGLLWAPDRRQQRTAWRQPQLLKQWRNMAAWQSSRVTVDRRRWPDDVQQRQCQQRKAHQLTLHLANLTINIETRILHKELFNQW